MKCDPNLYRAAPPSLAVKPRLIRQLFLPPLIIALMIGLGYIGFWISEYWHPHPQRNRRTPAGAACPHRRKRNQQIHLPAQPAGAGVQRLQAAGRPEPETRKTVNDYLEGLNRRSRSRAIYVMDTTGRVLATSNWRDADSYLGEDLSFRAYFQNAVRGEPGRFYGIGSTNGEPGYYLAHGLEEHGKIIGVAVVKVRLEALEERWQRARLEAFVSDENGIIILSSDPARRLKSVRPLSDDTKERLARSLQYYWWPLNELQPLARETLADGVEKLTFPANSEVVNDEHEVSYLAQTRPLNDTPWNFTLLTPLQDLRREAINQGILVAVAFGLLAILLIAWNERRKVIATRLAAREALQEANSQLERRIAERTADLRASNERLKGQIRERRQAEETLRRAQDELVQAGKLAAIGQMSTSIAHELNQPLAALRTLSGNTVRFLERGALETASANLKTINDLIDRMGRITASLRSFARRGDDQGQASLAKRWTPRCRCSAHAWTACR
jgi:two-component system sensor histidine kinase AauS